MEKLYKVICPHCSAEQYTKKTDQQKNGTPHSYAWCLKCSGMMIITYNRLQDDMTTNKLKLCNGE